MSLDATEVSLTRIGRIVIEGGEVYVSGFDGKNCTCRDVVSLALSYAIGLLRDELDATIRKPGGTGRTGID